MAKERCSSSKNNSNDPRQHARLINVLKTSLKRRLQDFTKRRLKDICKTCFSEVFRTLQKDVLKTFARHVFQKSLRLYKKTS